MGGVFIFVFLFFLVILFFRVILFSLIVHIFVLLLSLLGP